jgi:hypothetical protein
MALRLREPCVPTVADGALIAHRQRVPLACDPQVPGGPVVVVVGVGLGEAIDQALKRDQAVIAWDRDPGMFRAALSRYDWQHALLRGRLRLVLGPGLLRVDRALPRWIHPVLGAVYGWEIDSWERPAARRAMVVPERLLAAELADGLRARGWSVWPLPATRLSAPESRRWLRQWGPELVLSVNLIPGLSEVCAEHGARCVSWEIDPALTRIPAPGAVGGGKVFSWRHAQVPRLGGLGWDASYLPLAAPAHRRPVPPDPALASAACFVANSLSQGARRATETLISLWSRAALAGDARAALKQLRTAQAQDASVFQADRIPAALVRACRSQGLDPRVLVGEVVAHDKRVAWAKDLVPEGLQVWGDAGWKSLGDAWRGPAGHARTLTTVYSSTRVAVDIGRLHQQDIVTLRVFEAAACGALVVTEDSPALREVLEPGRHVLAGTGLDAMRDNLRWALAHPERAQAIADAGRDWVLAHHTLDQRLSALLAETCPSQLAS